MKTLIIDIETAPIVAHVWQLHGEQNIGINQIVDPGGMLCFAAKWMGEDEVMFFHARTEEDRAEMIQAAWDLLDEADVVMHFNGRRFDIPWLEGEFALARLGPTSPFQQIDLLTVVRRFRFPSHKLAYVSQAFGLDGKVSHEGHGLWTRCLANDDEAWALMQEYNERDVTLLEDLYQILQPWIRNHPSRHVLDGQEGGCPTCGSEHLMRRGYYHTAGSKFVKYQCQACFGYFRGTKSITRATLKAVS